MQENTPPERKPTAALTENQTFDLLSNPRRRQLLRALHSDAPLTKNQLSKRITEEEHPNEDTKEKHRKRVYISLHQQHLPTLTELDVLRETPDGYVLGENAGTLLEHLGYSSPARGLRDRLGSALGSLS